MPTDTIITLIAIESSGRSMNVFIVINVVGLKFHCKGIVFEALLQHHLMRRGIYYYRTDYIVV